MEKQDWYRTPTWTPEIQAKFFYHLNRLRNDFNKSQCIRIQAYTLQHESSPPLYQDAIELLDYLIKLYPHPSQLSSAYLQKAQCFEALGLTDAAIQAYISSFSAEKDYPQVKTNASFDFAMFVLKNQLERYYDIVLSNFEHIEELSLFPISQYQAYMAIAIILADKGKKKEARLYAQKALDATKKSSSGFHYHPTLGLVEQIDKQLYSRLQAIADGV
jgi:tetratricopeptide (TPR) repeat protein